MQKSYRNKNFLPEGYVKEKDGTTAKEEKRGLFLLLILALAMLPFAVKGINTNKNDKIINVEEQVEKYISKENVLFWLDLNYDGIQGDTNTNSASLEIDSKNVLESLSKNEKISINTINSIGDNKYKIELVKR